jgi:type II secretory pathway pseudopilin PulG
MEILVVVAIITVLAAIAFPIITRVKSNSYKTEATNRMKSLAAATMKYGEANDGALPAEDAQGKDGWDNAKKPESEKAWYNSLPHLMQHKSLGDFVREGRTAAFYTNEFVAFIPGAPYPKKLDKPYFAIAINSKLQRKDKEGKKGDVKYNHIAVPERTVLFFEHGMPGEPKADLVITHKDYDGACKGTAKGFAARYSSQGVLSFADGHAELHFAKDLLTTTGDLVWSEDGTTPILWLPDPKEDPNSKPTP